MENGPTSTQPSPGEVLYKGKVNKNTLPTAGKFLTFQPAGMSEGGFLLSAP